jgi:hypothetical protein
MSVNERKKRTPAQLCDPKKLQFLTNKVKGYE